MIAGFPSKTMLTFGPGGITATSVIGPAKTPQIKTAKMSSIFR